ncbi:MAG: efflux RND transporter periplasmic adaptor subunit [Vicinamibacterales bacterium]|nr:efflux transporter periplasmic adaptor subunit [Acidobacteriota bacterium]MDP7472515.1 efflux RND transporter periplasmic adaptor subunit [Vicinamibacterales bacterium]MDP7670513.1 efflux RND transporter periplasmic adaptor subunit [Vicinamibacterales bacterium]HJO38171.1 efflux RND transporter periplasmic adaptor subunit [Vicinamibacterales bacterium]
MNELKQNLESLRIDHDARTSRPGWWFWVSLVLIVLAVIGGGLWWTTGGLVVQTAPVTTATVRLESAADAAAADAVLNASGYVTARRRSTVSSKITGKVTEVLVEEGMQVREGQVLARLDDSTVRANLNYARAQHEASRRQVTESEVRLREAELTLDRRRQLVDEGVVGVADLDAAQAEADSLRARIELAREQVEVAQSLVAIRETELRDTVIRAPFDGVAISKDAQPGEMVSPVSAGGGFTRTGISTIVDMSSLEIEVDVNESYINRVRPDQAVEAVLDAYPDWRIPASVITTVPAADRQRATVLVRIAFDELDDRLLPDMGVKVAFLGEETRPDPERSRLIVPAAAVRTDGEQSVVFVIRDDRVERRAVALGSSDGDRVEIVSGLRDGEQIVVDGPKTLTDGDRVELP